MSQRSTRFEHVTCSRCGGCGHYSYCPMYGTRCFKCGGAGWVLTKRGQAAYNMFAESLNVPAGELVVGDLLHHDGFFTGRAGFHRITEIEHDGERVVLHTAACVHHDFPTSMVRKGWSAEDKSAKLEAALAYQATLTKAGTPRKRQAHAQTEGATQ